jgi:hypothetical protein
MNKGLKNKLFYFVFFFLFITNVYSGSPIWTFTPLTATNISLTATQTAAIQYTVTNQSHRRHALFMEPILGVNQITTGAGVCGASFVLEYQQSCTLSLQVNGAELRGNVFGGPVVCEQPNTLQCYQPAAGNQLAIYLESGQKYTITPSAGANGTISPNTVQTVDSGSNVVFTAIPNANYQAFQWLVDGVLVQTYGSTYQLTNVTANHTVAVTFQTLIPRFSYITQGSSQGILVCNVNAADGTLSGCVDAGGGSIISTITPEGIAIDNTGTYAFITSGNSSPANVYQCIINQSNGTFNSCSSTTITTPAGYTPTYSFITLNSTSTMAYLGSYVSGNSNPILACPISNGVISPICTNTGATGVGSHLVGITLNASNTVAYAASISNHYVTQCAVNGALFSSCINKIGSGFTLFSGPSATALNNTGTILYVVDYVGTAFHVYGCDTTETGTNQFSSCFIAASIPSDPFGIAINAEGTTAYVTDSFSNFYTCPILPDGTFSTCTTYTGTTLMDITLLY